MMAKTRTDRGRFFGRLSGNKAAELGAAMTEGAGFIAVGSFALLFNLPRRFQVADAEPYDPRDFPWEKLAPAPAPNQNWAADKAAARSAAAFAAEQEDTHV
jgi:hypothetical protein